MRIRSYSALDFPDLWYGEPHADNRGSRVAVHTVDHPAARRTTASAPLGQSRDQGESGTIPWLSVRGPIFLSVLTEACELEHGLACSYLFAAFSLKDQYDGGLSAEELHLARKWAGQVYFIAAQEMLHLAQVWNLLTAIGGTPYYFRPNFPQTAKYYP